MRPFVLRTAFAAALLLLTLSLFGATYIVPPDRELIQRAEHIVLATAISSHGELTREGAVVTVTELRVDDSLKGGLSAGATLYVTDPGGEVGSSRVVIFGAPRYRDGQRYLVFTEEWPDGRPRTYAIGLGKFDVVQDRSGRWLAMHGADSDVVGFDANSLDPYVEHPRDLQRFIDYVRGLVAQKISPEPGYFVTDAIVAPATDDQSVTAFAFTQASYLGLQGQLYRWGTPSVSWKLFGSQPSLNGSTAATTGAGAWTNDPASNVNYTVSASVPASTGGLTTADGQNVIAFNDPNGELGSFSGGLGGISAATPGKTPLPDGSGSAFSPTEVDIVVSKNFSPVAQNCLNTVITHEMGHTLGFRHSNKNADDSASCAAPADCSSVAVMTNVTQCSYNGVLQPWDQNAVQTVYGSGPVCTPPGITNISGTATISAGSSTPLSVTATGTATLSYQWYTGNSGNTASPVAGGTTANISVSPATTTSYWVRVTGQCAPAADSATLTVTVNPVQCTAPAITSGPASPTITAGNNATLTVTATGTAPLTYQWYIGAASSTSSPTGSNSASLIVNPTTTTQYWVRVTNSCGSKDSSTATVTVNAAQCIPPQIVNQPLDQTVVSGNTATLSVGHNNSNQSVVWYQGAPPNTSAPVGSGRVITTAPLTQTTTFYAILTTACGTVTTRTTTVTVSATCTPPAITSLTATPPTISFGLATNLSVVATGTSLSYQWFVGTSGDTGSPLNGATNSNVGVTATATTSYWVRVTSGCGAPAVNSQSIVVTVVACVLPSSLTIIAPANVQPGNIATLMADVTGSEPLKFQWFEGGNGDLSKPVGTDNRTFITPPLTKDTLYWVRVTNGCGGADALNVLVQVKPGRRRSASH